MTIAAAPPRPTERTSPTTAHPVHGTAVSVIPYPTSRGAALVAGTAALTALGAWQPWLGWTGLLLAIVAVTLIVVDARGAPEPSDLSCLRLGRPVLPLGTEHDVEIEIRARYDGIRSATTHRLRVVDDLHPGIARIRDPEPVLLPADVAIRVATRIRATRRGAFTLSTVHARLGGPLGLAERAVRFEGALDVRVLPGLGEIANVASVLRESARREAGLRRARLRGHGTAFESLREYVRGDDPRHVDWKASARHEKLICRNFEVERSQTIMLLIDAGRWMTSEVDGLTRLDRVLNACLLLAHVASRRDDRIGALVFSDHIERFVPPAKGRGAVDRILNAVYDVDARLVESDYRRAFAYLGAHHRKRSLLVLFTDVLSRDQSRLVIEECTRSVGRHLPLAVTLRDVGLDDLATGIPQNAAGAYRQAAAEELLLEREQALATMRQSGVHVLDVPPSRLAPAVVDRYLELKARMLI